MLGIAQRLAEGQSVGARSATIIAICSASGIFVQFFLFATERTPYTQSDAHMIPDEARVSTAYAQDPIIQEREAAVMKARKV